MPKKIDGELKASAIRLVNDHQGEYFSLTAAAAVVAKQLGVGKDSVRSASPLPIGRTLLVRLSVFQPGLELVCLDDLDHMSTTTDTPVVIHGHVWRRSAWQWPGRPGRVGIGAQRLLKGSQVVEVSDTREYGTRRPDSQSAIRTAS